MDPAVVAAWIGVGGALVGTIAGVVLGYFLTGWSQRRADRTTAATQLAGLRQLLYHPHHRVDVTVELDRLTVSLAGAGIHQNAIDALRKVALACNRSSHDFAKKNPDAPPSISESLLSLYTNLFGALTASLRHAGSRGDRKTKLGQAIEAVNQMS